MTVPITRDIMERWITALRSGEFAQGRDKLRFYDEAEGRNVYCCLGVLGEIISSDFSPDPHECNVLSEEMPEIEQTFGYRLAEQCLAMWNDSREEDEDDEEGSFSQIAALLEKHLPSAGDPQEHYWFTIVEQIAAKGHNLCSSGKASVSEKLRAQLEEQREASSTSEKTA